MLTLGDDISIFDRWALCAQMVGNELWVGAMSGEIAALDLDLRELRRWQAHGGSVNGIACDGQTHGGDGTVKIRDGAILFGPTKKPITKVQRHGNTTYVGTYERALYISGIKTPKIAAWHVLDDGQLVLVRKTGSKAGDLGPIEIEGREIGPPAWTLGPGSQRDSVRAFLKDGPYVDLTLSGEMTVLPWKDKSGPPTRVCAHDLEFLIGCHKVLALKGTEIVAELTLKTKGLYGSTVLPDGRLAIAGADGNLKIIHVAA